MTQLQSVDEARSNADIPPCVSAGGRVNNQENTVTEVIPKILEQRPEHEVEIVDDGSKDKPWEVLHV